MKLNQQNTPKVNTVRNFEPGKIKINDQYYEKSLLVTAEKIEENWPVFKVDDLNEEKILGLLAYQAEIIIIGSGKQHHFLDPMLSLLAAQQSIGIEIMTTEAACRTYNVLLGEDRRVLAALIIERNLKSEV